MNPLTVDESPEPLLAVTLFGPGTHTYRSWPGRDGRPFDKKTGEVYAVYLVNPSAASLSDVAVEAGGCATVDDEVAYTGTLSRSLGKVDPRSFVEVERLEDFMFDYMHEYDVTFDDAEGKKRALRFLVPKTAIFEAQWSDVPVLGRRGFVARGRTLPETIPERKI